MIVGTGELGPGGSGRSRFALELDAHDSPGVVAELAWLTGLVSYELEHYRGRWIDTASGEEVPETRLAERYADAVAARIGVRALESDGTIDAAGQTVLAPVTLERDLTFEVETEEEARAFANADIRKVGDRFKVTQKAGTQIRVPRVVAHTRRVAGQLPDGARPGPLRPPERPDRDRRPDGAREPRLHRRGLHRRGARRPRSCSPTSTRRRWPTRRAPEWAGWRRCDGSCSTTCSPSRARTTVCRSRSATSSPPTRSRPTSAPTAR